LPEIEGVTGRVVSSVATRAIEAESIPQPESVDASNPSNQVIDPAD
jgi:hypothetical protein